MRMTGRALGGDAAEWAGRSLVALQFGLLAFMGWRAWATLPALDIPAAAFVGVSAGMAVWTLAVNRPGNFNIRPTPRREGTLVTGGPYRWIRHPMYTSVLLGAAGAAWMSHQVLDAVLWLGLMSVLVVKAGLEERALVLRFPSYQDYKLRTTRFLPWLI